MERGYYRHSRESGNPYRPVQDNVSAESCRRLDSRSRRNDGDGDFPGYPAAMDYQSSAMAAGVPFVATADGMDSRFRGMTVRATFRFRGNDGKATFRAAPAAADSRSRGNGGGRCLSILPQTLWIPAFAGMTVGRRLSGMPRPPRIPVFKAMTVGVAFPYYPRPLWIPAFAGMTVGATFPGYPTAADSPSCGNDGGAIFPYYPGRSGFPLSRE